MNYRSIALGAAVLAFAFIRIASAQVIEPPKAICPPYCLDETTPSEEAEEPAEATEYVLEIRGMVTKRFQGHCDMLSADKSPDRIEFEGRFPKSYRFRAPEISCVVRKDVIGRLGVRLRREGELVAKAHISGRRLRFGGVKIFPGPMRPWVRVWYKNDRPGSSQGSGHSGRRVLLPFTGTTPFSEP